MKLKDTKTGAEFLKKLGDAEISLIVLMDAIDMATSTSVPFETEDEEKEWDKAINQLSLVYDAGVDANDKVSAALTKALERYEKGNWDEADALSDLFAKGYALEDFSYDPVRYEWAKNIAEEHGLI